MNLAIKLGRIFYSIALIVYGIQQFIYGNFRPVFFPPWQSSLPLLSLWAYIFGIALIAAASMIIFCKHPKEVFLLLGALFLALLLFAHIPYELISEPNHTYHLGVWSNALKELAFAGGAFVMAGSYPEPLLSSRTFRALEKLIPFGNIFYSITIICFGVAHFMYSAGIATILPSWFPDHLFWTYFAAVALIGSGVFILLNTRRRLIAILQSIMLFSWFILIHAPSAIAHPDFARGNQLASAFDALLFSGVALVIGCGLRYQAGDKI